MRAAITGADRARKGNGIRQLKDQRKQLESIYLADRRGLYACALAVTRSPEMAEDAVHEAFSRLVRREPEAENLRAYVFRAVRNAAVDQLRRLGPPTTSLNGHLFDHRDDPVRQACMNEFSGRVAAALAELSQDQREAIVLHVWGQLKFREIAEMREVPIPTVTAWYRRGLQKLRAIMEE